MTIAEVLKKYRAESIFYGIDTIKLSEEIWEAFHTDGLVGVGIKEIKESCFKYYQQLIQAWQTEAQNKVITTEDYFKEHAEYLIELNFNELSKMILKIYEMNN